jgi:hypothetical protein
VVRLSCRKAHVEEDGQFERKIIFSKKQKVNQQIFF